MNKINQSQKSFLTKWSLFLWGLGFICVVAFILIPWFCRNVASEMTNSINIYGISATALFYSETRTTSEAFNYFSNSQLYEEKE